MEPMKTLILINLYLMVSVLFYSYTSSNVRENLDKREFLTGASTDPHHRAFFEFMALLLSLAWFITVPLLVARQLSAGRR